MKILSINDLNYKYNFNWTILQFCFKNNIDQIPKFCYHEKLSIAGNCRMCLVEDNKSIKPIAACTIILSNNMVIYTNTIKVKKCRESVLEFLLINHPLDCPICCQGGECDLQDLSEIFGGDKGRFYESKRAVINKNFGPFIKTIMNRCIHCTRCVRFAIEISGCFDIGIVGRGAKMEISSYINKIFSSELSGNIIDLCPVGALTSKPYSFMARSWELKSLTTLNLFDSFIPSIRVDVRGGEILRVLPQLNINFNNEWICDDIRYCFDALKNQRLIYPIILINKLILKLSWRKVFFFIKDYFINILLWLRFNKYKFFPINITFGPSLDFKTILLFKDFFNYFGSSLNLNKINNNILFSNYYLLPKHFSINAIESLIIFGNNLRFSNPLFYLQIRKSFLENKINIYTFGFFSSTNFYIKHLGSFFNFFINVIEGKTWLSVILRKKNLKILLTSSFFENNFINQTLFYKFQELYNIINHMKLKIIYISETPTEIIKNHLGIQKSIHNQNFNFCPLIINYIVGSDKLNKKYSNFNKNLTIYQGHNADLNINYCNIILPSASFFEIQNLKFIDITGSLKITNKIINLSYNVRSDYNIICSLLVYLGLSIIKKNFNYKESQKLYFKFISSSTNFINFHFNFFVKSFFYNFIFKNSLTTNSLNLKNHKLFSTVSNWVSLKKIL